MSFPRHLFSSCLLSGTVFCLMTLPLAGIGQKNVRVQVEESAVFVGEARDLAAPYLLTAMGISLGVGAVGLASLGWNQCSKKLSESEDKLLSMKKQVDEQVALVESIKFSGQRIEALNLSSFLHSSDENSEPLPRKGAKPSTPTAAECSEPSVSLLNIPYCQPQTHSVAGYAEHSSQALNTGDAETNEVNVQQEVAAQPEQLQLHPSDQDPQSIQISDLLHQIQLVAAQVERMNTAQSNQLVSVGNSIHSRSTRSAA